MPVKSVQVLGVAQSVRKANEAGRVETFPAVYLGKGEQSYAGFDDKYAVCSYHRALNMSVSVAPGLTYGDNPGNIRLSHRMSLVIMANRDETGLSPDQLALTLQFAIPGKLTKDQMPKDFLSNNIIITDVVLSESQVFAEEFANMENAFGPEHVLLKCNYTIESTLNKRCFNTQCLPDGTA